MRFLKTFTLVIPAGISGLIIKQVLSVIIVQSVAHIVSRNKQVPSREENDASSTTSKSNQ